MLRQKGRSNAKIEMICAHNFYNIFTTTFKWQVVIVGLKK